jgi:hypothetical protein
MLLPNVSLATLLLQEIGHLVLEKLGQKLYVQVGKAAAVIASKH